MGRDDTAERRAATREELLAVKLATQQANAAMAAKPSAIKPPSRFMSALHADKLTAMLKEPRPPAPPTSTITLAQLEHALKGGEGSAGVPRSVFALRPLTLAALAHLAEYDARAPAYGDRNGSDPPAVEQARLNRALKDQETAARALADSLGAPTAAELERRAAAARDELAEKVGTLKGKSIAAGPPSSTYNDSWWPGRA